MAGVWFHCHSHSFCNPFAVRMYYILNIYHFISDTILRQYIWKFKHHDVFSAHMLEHDWHDHNSPHIDITHSSTDLFSSS